MNNFLSWIRKHVTFFLGYLGLTYLSQELWNWFSGDSLLRNAVTITIILIFFDVCRLLFKKFNKKKMNLFNC